MKKRNVSIPENYNFVLNKENVELLKQLGLTEMQLASLIVILKNPPQKITKYQAGDEDDYPKYSDHMDSYTATRITEGTYYTYQDMPVEVNIIVGTPKQEIIRLLDHLIDEVKRCYEGSDIKHYEKFMKMQRKIHNPHGIPGCMLPLYQDKESVDPAAVAECELEQRFDTGPPSLDSDYF